MGKVGTDQANDLGNGMARKIATKLNPSNDVPKYQTGSTYLNRLSSPLTVPPTCTSLITVHMIVKAMLRSWLE